MPKLVLGICSLKKYIFAALWFPDVFSSGIKRERSAILRLSPQL